MTCCGMSAKVLISELRKKHSRGIYLDIGSALDYVCTKKCSRGNKYSYEYIENVFRDLIPDNWNIP